MSDIPVPGAGAAVPSRASKLATVDTIRMSLTALLVTSFGVVLLRTFRQAVDGDESIFLSSIHRAANGQELGLLQTAYVHLFAWLPFIGANEISQVTLGRLSFVLVWAGSLMLLYKLGRRLLDPIGALAAVVLFAIFSYSIGNAATFRIDALLLPLLLAAAVLLLNPSVGRVAAAGAVSALAVAFTIKAVLWAPALFGVLAVGLWREQDRLRPILAGAVAGTVSLAVIMLVHAQLIAMQVAEIPETLGRGSSVAGRYMLLNGFLPRWEFLERAVVENPSTWALIAIGLYFALAGLRQPDSRRQSLILLVLALPIVSVAFYTNAFPYAYLVLIPTTCLLAGHAVSKLVGSGERIKMLFVLGCLGIAAIPMAVFAWEYRVDRQEHQEQIVTTVHGLFPEPVPYIDVSGLVASFPRPNLNITWFGLDLYRSVGVPVLSNYIRRERPPLLIVNTELLQVWDTDRLAETSASMRLLPTDEDTIRAAYAHYWDQIYLAGRQWRDLAADAHRTFDIVIPGDHTLLARGPVIVDGQAYAPGATLRLAEGPHQLRTTVPEPDLRILWGTGLTLPDEAATTLPDAAD